MTCIMTFFFIISERKKIPCSGRTWRSWRTSPQRRHWKPSSALVGSRFSSWLVMGNFKMLKEGSFPQNRYCKRMYMIVYDDWYARLVLLFVSFKEMCKDGVFWISGVQNGSCSCLVFGFLFKGINNKGSSCWAGIKLEFPPGHSPISKSFFSRGQVWVMFDSAKNPGG